SFFVPYLTRGGYPIWWGEEPRIMDTFVESYSFEGITMIPFCTSSSSGIGRSGWNGEGLFCQKDASVHVTLGICTHGIASWNAYSCHVCEVQAYS
ncbi:MAG: hypothetical protein IJT05_06085, partial [Lachnospiraceae bacterium]|nr:hypothetical protein [Lachnospiraceae bacterium]